MPAYQIQPQEWASFCESFTRQHWGVLVTIEIMRPNETPRVEAHDIPLHDVSMDKLGVFNITVGYEPGAHLTHFTSDMAQVWFDTMPDGAHAGLRLAAADGTTTRLRFRVPFLPET